jgi:FKBP-type peptidyl-prolyl cis-trans isomerase FkpA
MLIVPAILPMLTLLQIDTRPIAVEHKAGQKHHAGIPGLKIKDLVVGKGKPAIAGETVTVDYTGKLKNGSVFDTSIGRAPFSFPLGAGQVIKGWDLGVAGMREGGKRVLTIAPELGYGDRDMGKIPPHSTLIFTVKLIKIER